jgi:hypothetical protein
MFYTTGRQEESGVKRSAAVAEAMARQGGQKSEERKAGSLEMGDGRWEMGDETQS